MIQIENRELLGKVIAESLVRINNNAALSTFAKTRWINAIAETVVIIDEQSEFIDYHPKLNMATIWNVKTDRVCNANGNLECEAIKAGFPSKHRAVQQPVNEVPELAELRRPGRPAAFRPRIRRAAVVDIDIGASRRRPACLRRFPACTAV